MAGFSLKKHMVFDWDGKEYRIIELHGSGQLILENTKDGLLEIVTRERILAEYKAGKVSTNTPGNLLNHMGIPVYSRPLDELSERDKQEILRRKHYLDRIFVDGKPFLTAKHLNPLIAKAAAEIGEDPPPDSLTVYRWYRKVRDSNNILSLKSGISRRGSRKLKQSELVLKLTADGISETLKQSPLAKTDDIYTAVWGKINEENRKRLPQDQIKMFTKRTLYRMLKTADVYELTALREGKSAANRKFKVVMQGAKTKYVLERVEIDHTPLDLFLVDDNTGLPLGRPTLTVALDHFSRMLLGYYLTFDSPSAAAVMGALRHAILPKTPVDEVLPNLKVNNPWPCYGMLALIVVDNGLEFHGIDLESVAFDLGMNIQFCGKKQPWLKGSVERYLKTINYSFVNQFPGVSFAKYFMRGDYDPLKCALLTMAEFKHAFEKWVLDIYSQKLHSGIGVTPWSRWHESVAKKEPELPIDVQSLQRRISLVEERTLQNNGILLNFIRYNGFELAPILNAYGAGLQVRVLYDPEDLAEIQVWGPDQPEPITVKALEYEYAKGLTLKQHKCLRKQFLELGKTTFNEEELLQAKYELQQAVFELLGSRKLKSRKRGAALAGINSKKPSGSEIMLKNMQKSKSTDRPKIKKQEISIDTEMPPLLPTFTLE